MDLTTIIADLKKVESGNEEREASFGTPEGAFIAKPRFAHYYSDSKLLVVFHSKVDVKDFVTKPKMFVNHLSYETFLLGKTTYRMKDLQRLAYLVRRSVDAEFPLPEEKNTNGISMKKYIEKAVDAINNANGENGAGAVLLELRPYNKDARGWKMQKRLPQKATFKPLKDEILPRTTILDQGFSAKVLQLAIAKFEERRAARAARQALGK